jgi:uncharacterized membrane protein
MEDKNNTLIVTNTTLAILALANTIFLISMYKSGFKMVLSLAILALYVSFLVNGYKKFKTKTGKGVFLAIVGLFLFVFANFFACLGIPWDMH